MFRALMSAAGALLLSGCASQLQTSETLFGLVTPYRMEIVQGNVITKEQIARLKPGMQRRQVVDVMGSPLVTDIFHAERWDYVFTMRRQGAEPQRRTIVLSFKGDVLERIDAPELPSEREFVSSITRGGSFAPRKLELTPEEREALPKPPPRETPAAEPVGPVRPYPPLES